jgi:hypothetical protein
VLKIQENVFLSNIPVLNRFIFYMMTPKADLIKMSTCYKKYKLNGDNFCVEMQDIQE